MHYIWDTKMNKTDPPQLGGTKGGGMFEVWRMGEMRETSSSYRAAHCDGSIGRWSQCSESSTDSSVQACEGETDRCTGSGKGKYEMMWVAFLEVLGKMSMRFSSKKTCADIHSLNRPTMEQAVLSTRKIIMN